MAICFSTRLHHSCRNRRHLDLRHHTQLLALLRHHPSLLPPQSPCIPLHHSLLPLLPNRALSPVRLQPPRRIELSLPRVRRRLSTEHLTRRGRILRRRPNLPSHSPGAARAPLSLRRLTIRSSSRPPLSRAHGPPLVTSPRLTAGPPWGGPPPNRSQVRRFAAAHCSLPFGAGTARPGLVAAAAAA